MSQLLDFYPFSNPGQSGAAALERIQDNRRNRLMRSGDAGVTGEEADWLLNNMVLKADAAREEQARIVKWLRANGHEEIALDIEHDAHREDV